MLRAVWNLAALLMFGGAGIWGLVLARLDLWPALLPTLGILAALSWGFYRRRFARWRTVVGWAYAGLCQGILGGIGGQDRPFWLLGAWVVGIGILLLALPGRFNGLFWTADLLTFARRAGGWRWPRAENRCWPPPLFCCMRSSG